MTINGSTSSIEWGYKLEVNEIGTSVQNRTSTIEVKTYVGRTRSWNQIGGSYTNTCSITGASTQSSSGSIPWPTNLNAGEYYHLKTFTFTVPNTGNPTTVAISSELKDTQFTPSYGSANGSMQLTILHLNPVIETADMVETNSVLTALNVPNTTVVQYLSQKTITLHGTAYDDATIDKYRLRHFNTDYNIPSASTYQSSNVFNTDYTTHDISIGSGKANIIQDIGDTLSGTSTDWVYVNIGGEAQKPNGIAYTKPIIEKTSTTIKRKSGGGTTLTDNKAVLNLKATYYKENDIIGNNNNIQQIGYKIWESGTSEPANYTALTPTTSGGNITITDFEISNMVYTKIYNYKIILEDRYGYQDTIDDGILPTGQSVWTEYPNRVDFPLKLTVKGYNPFEYSENETICGVWRDSNNEEVPIYRKQLGDIGVLNNGATKNFDVSLLNINKIFKIEGMIEYNSNYATSLNRIIYYYDIANDNVTIYNNENLSINDGFVYIEYTKTAN